MAKRRTNADQRKSARSRVPAGARSRPPEDARLEGRTVVVGVCGGISAYKVAYAVSALRRRGAQVHVVMTEAATRFVGAVTFKALSQNPVVTDMWDPDSPWDEPHVALGEKAHLFLVAPATADIIGRLAAGLAGDVVSATALATRAPVLLAPAMSDVMYEAPAFRENLDRLRARGYHVIGPEYGRLASGKEGWGRMSEPDAIVEAAVTLLHAGPPTGRRGR